MKINLKKELQPLVDQIREAVPEIIAETATEYYQETFRKKAFDGQPWPGWSPGYKRSNGSLMVDTRALLGSIRPTLISWPKVVISAGNEKVKYARAHNEGFVGSVVVPSHQRTSPSGKASKVKQYTMNMRLPQRQFMGDAKELEQQIHDNVEGYIHSLTK